MLSSFTLILQASFAICAIIAPVPPNAVLDVVVDDEVPPLFGEAIVPRQRQAYGDFTWRALAISSGASWRICDG
jgi:hypothetical protein